MKTPANPPQPPIDRARGIFSAKIASACLTKRHQNWPARPMSAMKPMVPKPDEMASIPRGTSPNLMASCVQQWGRQIQRICKWQIWVEVFRHQRLSGHFFPHGKPFQFGPALFKACEQIFTWCPCCSKASVEMTLV